MNDLVVAIKVDREERPDVDQIYMEAVQRMTGSGRLAAQHVLHCRTAGRSWAAPTSRRAACTTGRASPRWCSAVARAWREQRERRGQGGGRGARVARRAARGDRARPARAGVALAPRAPDDGARGPRATAASARRRSSRRATNLEAVLAAAQLGVARGDALEHLVFTLERMARGGIFDQLGGGFHRYSTDERWLVPHFEKMLYDNGQLLRVYAEAYRQTRRRGAALAGRGDDRLARARDARPRGRLLREPGRRQRGRGRPLLRLEPATRSGRARRRARRRASAPRTRSSPRGNFEHTGKSVLAHGLAGERPRFAEARARCSPRARRAWRPATDRKNVCSWIGYAISGLALVGLASSRARTGWRRARAPPTSRSRGCRSGGRGLLRIYEAASAKIPAFLDDHAALLCGAARPAPRRRRATATWTPRSWWPTSCARASSTRARRELFFTPGGDADAGAAARERLGRRDARGVGARRARRWCALAALTGRAELAEVVDAVLEREGPVARRAPLVPAHAGRARAALREAEPGVALVLGAARRPAHPARSPRARARCSGPRKPSSWSSRAARPPWLAPEWLEGREMRGGAPTAYVCRGRTCSLPALTPEELETPAP